MTDDELSKAIRATLPVPKKEPWSVSIPFVIQSKAACLVELWMYDMYRLENLRFGLPSGLTAAVAFAARDDMEDVFTRKLIEDEREAHKEHPARWYATMPPFKSKSAHYKIVVTVRNRNKWIVNTKLDLGGNLIPGMNLHGMAWIAYVDGVQVAEKRTHTIEEVDKALEGGAPEILTYDKVPGLPPIDIEDATDEQVTRWFLDDLFQYVREDGSIVDVGWLPEGDRNGSFRCVVVEKADPDAWTKPIEEFRTKLVAEAKEWVLARTAPHIASVIP